MADEEHSRELARSTIVRSVHCRRCGYDLRGLSPLGQCPECGLDTWQTILSTVDPASSKLPQLRNPGRVGDGLSGLMALVLVASLGLAARPLSILLHDRGWLLEGLPEWTRIAAGGVGLLALWPLMMLAPPRGKEPYGPIWRDIWRLGTGVAGWSLLIAASGIGHMRDWDEQAQELLALLRCAPAVIGLVGLNGILKVIGLRSREYRTSRGARQSARAMVAAVLFGAAGHSILLFRWQRFGPAAGDLTESAHLLVFMSHVMLLIGLAYLVANGWWIRRALRHPPPALDELLGDFGPGRSGPA